MREIEERAFGKAGEWTEPNDQRLFQRPNQWDDGLYGCRTEYREFTFIAVLREAREKKTSMREICRRRNLTWEALII